MEDFMKFFNSYLIVHLLALGYANISAINSGERGTLRLLAKARTDLAKHIASQKDDKDSVSVGMWGQGSISVTPESVDTKTIYTNGLGGCIAAAYMVRCKSGARHVAMNHYPPISRSEQVSSLRQSVNKFSRDCNDDFLSRELVILTPGEYFKDSRGKYSIFKPSNTDLDHISALGAAAKIKQPLVSPYSMIRSSDEKFFPDFRVELKPNSTFWYSFGDFHKPHEVLELKDHR